MTKTLRDAQGADVLTFVLRITAARLTQNPLCGAVQPAGDAAAPVVTARVDSGRLVGDCPACAGAELIDPLDLRFYCLSCYNAAAGNAWLPVTIPVEVYP